MVGQILAIAALAVFAAPLLLMLYLAARYVIGLIPREVRDDRTRRGHAAHDRPGHGRTTGACAEPGCQRPRGARPDEATGPPGARPRYRAHDGANRRDPSGAESGCLACGHSLVHHEPGSRGGCTWSRAGWRWERVHRDDDWNTGWIDERRWDPGAPCGCPAYVAPGAR